MTQMKGGLNSHGCAGLPLPRDFGHFASPSWLTITKRTKIKKSHNVKMAMANESWEGGGSIRRNGVSWNKF